MKYNSIGEQLVAKAKEIDPSYKPDKFNDMSEAINIILNNSGSGGSSSGGKLEGFSIDVSDTYNSETKEFSGTLTDEQWTKVQNEQIYWINVVYINNQETGEEASATLLYNGPFFGEGRTFADGNGSAMFIYDKSVEGVIIKAALTVDTQGTPTSQLIPSITTSNEQQNLTIGDGLAIENGALKATGSGSGSNVKIFQPTINVESFNYNDDSHSIEIIFSNHIFNEIKEYVNSLISANKSFSIQLLVKSDKYLTYQFIANGSGTFYDLAELPFSIDLLYDNAPGNFQLLSLIVGNDNSSSLWIQTYANLYSDFKSLASMVFTNNTVIKVTVISYD